MVKHAHVWLTHITVFQRFGLFRCLQNFRRCAQISTADIPTRYFVYSYMIIWEQEASISSHSYIYLVINWFVTANCVCMCMYKYCFVVEKRFVATSVTLRRRRFSQMSPSPTKRQKRTHQPHISPTIHILRICVCGSVFTINDFCCFWVPATDSDKCPHWKAILH